jgi:ribonuclease HI
MAACGGTFRSHLADNLGSFADNLGFANAFRAELVGAMFAIEIAYYKGWHNLWLETDSKLVTRSFTSINIVPWDLRNRWLDFISNKVSK